MRFRCHLIVSATGKVRTTKNIPAIDADEIAIGLTLDIPDAMFRRPYPIVSITLPEPPDAPTDAIIDATAQAVADSLHVSVEDVRDHLASIVRDA